MSVDKFIFQTESQARAFEAGIWFHSGLPATTEVCGMTVIVSDRLGSETNEHVYPWEELPCEPVESGDRPLVSKIHFRSATETEAFVSALSWFSGCFVTFEMNGTEVTVREKRSEYDPDEPIVYEFDILQRLIAEYRALTPT